MGEDADINLENVRLSAELTRIYSRLLQVIYLMEARTESETVTDLVNIADSIRETIGELPLHMEGEMDDGKDID